MSLRSLKIKIKSSVYLQGYDSHKPFVDQLPAHTHYFSCVFISVISLDSKGNGNTAGHNEDFGKYDVLRLWPEIR